MVTAPPRPTRHLGTSPGSGGINPLDIFTETGVLPLDIPDPITFVVGGRWLNRANLYPRQATLLKIIFLRDDLFTDYDYEVIREWTKNFTVTGNNGIQPDVLERIQILKARGYKWFREVLLVMGRRAGKGHVAALAMAYILWHYLAKGDPQGYYGIDRDKAIQVLIFAGKKDQAKANLWKDLKNVITGSTCFAPYVNRSEAEKVSVYAPNDKRRLRKLAAQGIKPGDDIATFHILPKESTLMSGRGPTSAIMGFDEMAHVVASGANRGAEEVYGAATPSLDQFGKDAFIIEPSSPWQMTGQFYINYQNALELDEETQDPLYPAILMIQLASWDIYVDWERAPYLPLFPEEYTGDLDEYAPVETDGVLDPMAGSGVPRFLPLRGAIQTYDEEMQRLQKSNPETFAVERLSHFATAQDAYLNPDMVDKIFEAWNGMRLQMQERGILIRTYKAHGDPSKSNANFGFALAHAEEELVHEIDEKGRPQTRVVKHAVFDLIHHFNPADFPNQIINYGEVEDWCWKVIERFMPDELTFDQWNSASSIQRLEDRVRNAGLPKRVEVFEKTATRPLNWTRYENFKSAVNLGLVHAPYYEQAELELKFLMEKNGSVEHQTTGPVQTKDVADCLAECVHVLIGEQMNAFRTGALSSLRPGGTLSKQSHTPFAAQHEDNQLFSQLSGGSGARGRGAMGAPMGRGMPSRMRRGRS